MITRTFAAKLFPMWTLLEGFESLTPEELEALLEAPLLITILVGAADGTIDDEESYWSERLMQVRTYAGKKILVDFYREAAVDFLEKVAETLSKLPQNASERGREIATRLEKLNPILAKLDVRLGAALYKSFLMLARETAHASGGFLRIGAVSAAEHEWVDLKMLTPIFAPKTEDKEEESDDADEVED